MPPHQQQQQQQQQQQHTNKYYYDVNDLLQQHAPYRDEAQRQPRPTEAYPRLSAQIGDEEGEEVVVEVGESQFQAEKEYADRRGPRSGFCQGRRLLVSTIVLLAVVGAIVGGAMAAGKPSGQSSSQSSSSSNHGNSPRPPDSTSPGSTPTASTLLTALQARSVTGGIEFQDTSSYQSQAYVWLLQNPVIEGSSTNETSSDPIALLDRQIQRFALACLFYATNQISNLYVEKTLGASFKIFPWQDSRGWLQEQNECLWNGIVCDDNGYVTTISLSGNLLTGTIPNELGYLGISLQTLDLSKNLFYNRGDNETSFLAAFSKLERLFLGNSPIQYDGLPPSLAYLNQLIALDASYALFHGPLRDDIFQHMTQLQYLYISGNSFNSTIPRTLAQLPALKYLYIEYADLMDNLTVLAEMPAVEEAWLDRNPALTGSIPSKLGQVSTLQSFSITRCSLTGSLPTQLGLLTQMKQMWLYYNQLTGTIPTELGQMSLLTRLELESNLFAGTMPEQICGLVTPFGLLDELDADSSSSFSCSCCTCVGATCADRSNNGGRRRNLLERKKDPSLP